MLGVESRNLDLFLQGEAGVKGTFFSADGDVAVVEGAMGYYDGLNGGTTASAWDLSTRLRIPTILVVRPKGGGMTLAAQIRGMQVFRPQSGIVGLLLCDCSARKVEGISELIERECALPVLGFLPPMEEARLESRHLGLLTAGEVDNFWERFDRLALQVEQNVDLDRLLVLAEEIRPTVSYVRGRQAGEREEPVCRIAVARDEAFCFHYADNLDALRSAGAELTFFSPLRDTILPEAEGLWLCGGYPELYARQLSENTEMRSAIREHVLSGGPTVAECGGFLYLQKTLEDSHGKAWPMCGALAGDGFRTGRLQRFGYLKLKPENNSMLFRDGEQIPAHEFHYWDTTENGEDLEAGKADGRSWRCRRVSETLYAAFPHLHFGGELPLAERFVKACTEYGNNR